jgi:hypothetical protein
LSENSNQFSLTPLLAAGKKPPYFGGIYDDEKNKKNNSVQLSIHLIAFFVIKTKIKKS